MKRFLSILLVITLVVSCSVTAFAQTTFKQKTGDFTSKDGLWKYGLYKNDDGKIEAWITDYVGSEKSITLPTEVDNYAVTMVQYCDYDTFTTVEHITIPKNYIKFGALLFAYKENLKSVTFSREYQPGDIMTFGNYMFRNCPNLEKVVLPNCLPSTHNYNGNLQKFYDGAKLRTGMFENCKKLKEVVLPEQLAEVDIGVFRNCESLETIKLPDGVVVLGEKAFEGTKSLKTLVVPDTVEYARNSLYKIGENASVICNPSGYLAEEIKLAKEHSPSGYQFKIVSSVNTTLKGDINKDNKFNVLDVTALQKYLAKIDSIEYVNTDMIDHNQDGKINIIDCTKMQKELVKIE